MIYDGIVFKNNKYEVYVKYQDGTDFVGKFDTQEEAENAWCKGHKLWNNVERKTTEADVYKLIPVTEDKLFKVR